MRCDTLRPDRWTIWASGWWIATVLRIMASLMMLYGRYCMQRTVSYSVGVSYAGESVTCAGEGVTCAGEGELCW